MCVCVSLSPLGSESGVYGCVCVPCNVPLHVADSVDQGVGVRDMVCVQNWKEETLAGSSEGAARDDLWSWFLFSSEAFHD